MSIPNIPSFLVSAALGAATTVFSADQPAQVTENNLFVAVPGFVAPQPGEHPRLFFRRNDLPSLRARAQTPEGKQIITLLKRSLGGGEAMPTQYSAAVKANDDSGPIGFGAYSLWHGSGFGLLWQITGEKRYADLGRQCVEKALAGQYDSDSRYAFINPRALLRAGPAFGAMAMAYDLCYDGWDEEFRRMVATQIMTVKFPSTPDGSLLFQQLALKPMLKPQSNHWGLQVGGAGLAALALRGDPGVDHVLIENYLASIEHNLIKQLQSGYGEDGYFYEHEGPGQINSTLSLIPFLQALRVADGKDYVSAVKPNARWITLRWTMELLPSADGSVSFPCNAGASRAGYGGQFFERGGGHFAGQFGQGFGVIPPRFAPAMLWVYQHLVEPGEQSLYAIKQEGPGTDAVTWAVENKPTKGRLLPNEKSYDCLSYPQRAVLSFVNWPVAIKPENPETVMPKFIEDPVMGHYVMRNRWQDANDIIVTALLGARDDKGLKRLVVWGLGQRLDFGSFKRATPTFTRGSADGSGIVCAKDFAFAVDFSKASGADALLVLVGTAATGSVTGDRAKSTTVSAGGNSITIVTLQTGDPPQVAVAGDDVVVGKQIISYREGKISLSLMGDPPSLPK